MHIFGNATHYTISLKIILGIDILQSNTVVNFVMSEVIKLLILVAVVSTLSSCGQIPGNSIDAYIDGGSLISLSSLTSIPEQLKKDFLYSTLYAQINASSSYDRQKSGTSWYNEYVAVLRCIGWNVTKSEFSVIALTSFMSWKENIESVLDKKLSQSEAYNLDSALTAFLRIPVSNGSVKVFNLLSTKGDISTFQIIPAFLNQEGDLVATFGLFNIVEIEQRSVAYNTEATGFEYSVGAGILNADRYEKYRNQVEAQLSDKIKEYIYFLKL